MSGFNEYPVVVISRDSIPAPRKARITASCKRAFSLAAAVAVSERVSTQKRIRASSGTPADSPVPDTTIEEGSAILTCSGVWAPSTSGKRNAAETASAPRKNRRHTPTLRHSATATGFDIVFVISWLHSIGLSTPTQLHRAIAGPPRIHPHTRHKGDATTVQTCTHHSQEGAQTSRKEPVVRPPSPATRPP